MFLCPPWDSWGFLPKNMSMEKGTVTVRTLNYVPTYTRQMLCGISEKLPETGSDSPLTMQMSPG